MTKRSTSKLVGPGQSLIAPLDDVDSEEHHLPNLVFIEVPIAICGYHLTQVPGI